MLEPVEYASLLVCIPVISFLYASVGHGGASGYIALMYIYSFSPDNMKPIALTMNLFVAGIAFYHYWKQGFFNARLFILFAIGSIPLSFLGGYLKVDPFHYQLILWFFLTFAILRLSGIMHTKILKVNIGFSPATAIPIGMLVGFTSGLVGIGGGIILTPLLLLLNWSNMKEAAAVSAIFIWVNSFAGLSGQLAQGIMIPSITWPMVLAAVVGGFVGSYYGANKLNPLIVKRLLLAVLLIATIKLSYSLWHMM